MMQPDKVATGEAFHEGERAMQARAGMRAHLAAIGSRVMRASMPEQHREFFRQLPFIVAGSVDDGGQAWASVLVSAPGFVDSPDPQHLAIRARPLAGDPLQRTLHEGAVIGLLGIEPHTRRRNRANGVVEHLAADGFAVRITQSFGNCPKYIQAREPRYAAGGANGAPTVHRAHALDEAARRMIRRADTFFIATAHPAGATGDDGDAAHGADVSHRGGRPGFVRVAGDGVLTVPDFSGNFFFNTLGNLAVNPRAGLLFADFDSGDLLYVAVDAEVIWGGAQVDAFEGAQRLLRLTPREVLRVESSLPLHWSSPVQSPFLRDTGTWGEE
jgi:hypothetical protein